MRVISKSRLREFWKRPGHQDVEHPLRAWYTHVSHKTVSWRNWGDVRSVFGNVDLVGNCVVFNIGGNKYRLIVRILYPSRKVFILKVLTHREYDNGRWKEECGCFSGPPGKSAGSSARPRPNRKRGES